MCFLDHCRPSINGSLFEITSVPLIVWGLFNVPAFVLVRVCGCTRACSGFTTQIVLSGWDRSNEINPITTAPVSLDSDETFTSHGISFRGTPLNRTIPKSPDYLKKLDRRSDETFDLSTGSCPTDSY